MLQHMISTGLRDAGYVYISPGEIGYLRNATTQQLELEFPEHFTGGDLKHLAGWLHANGFKFSNGVSPGKSVVHGRSRSVRPPTRWGVVPATRALPRRSRRRVDGGAGF